MGPHDLLCKWCSTFVGKDKQFCSIFCESRHTRSKRRKLAYKRPVKSSGSEGHFTEYVSPRTNNTAPSKKQFLEDVITAMTMDDYKARDKGRTDKRGNDATMSKGIQTSGSSNIVTSRKSAIPRLDMSKLRDNNDKQDKSEKRSKDTSKPEYKLKSKTHTILVHPKKDSNTLNRKTAVSSAKGSLNKAALRKSDIFETPSEKPKLGESDAKENISKSIIGTQIESETKQIATNNAENKSKTVSKSTKSENFKSQTLNDYVGSKKEGTILENKSTKPYMYALDDKTKRTHAIDKGDLIEIKPDSKTQSQKYKSDKSDKTDSDKAFASEHTGISDDIDTLPMQHSTMSSDLAQRIRSSGYGAPVNPRLRPVALKPRSANMLPSKMKRESSATSTKSLTLGVNREKSRPIITDTGQSKWELVQKPIKEEQPNKDVRVVNEKTKRTLEHEDPSPTSSSRTKSKEAKDKFDNSKRELQSIDELLREESTGSILDQSVLQNRLRSIKKKVEVRRRGRDSRSSIGSDLDSTLDTSFEVPTSRDKLNTSYGDGTTPSSTARTSARANITRISKEFRSTKVN